MKKMEDIRLLVEKAQNIWDDIYDEMKEHNISESGSLCVKKEKLKNLLEVIRRNLEVHLLSSKESFFRRMTVNLLERLLDISEALRKSYTFPGYQESFYIADTIEMAKR